MRSRSARRIRPAAPTGAGVPRLLPPPAPLRSGPDLFSGHPVGRRLTVEVDRGDVLLRPVVPSDLDAIDAFVRDLSPRARFLRFHAAVRRLTLDQLAGLVDVDHRERETMVAVADGRVVALGQYVAVAAGTAELAVAVADAWRRRGLGALLVGQLAGAARAAGLAAFTASVLAENRPALAMFERWPGSVRVERHGTELELLLTLDLPGGEDEPRSPGAASPAVASGPRVDAAHLAPGSP